MSTRNIVLAAIVAIAIMSMFISPSVQVARAQSVCDNELAIFESELGPLMRDFARQAYRDSQTPTAREFMFSAVTIGITSIMTSGVVSCDSTLERVEEFINFSQAVLLLAVIYDNPDMLNVVNESDPEALPLLERRIDSLFDEIAGGSN